MTQGLIWPVKLVRQEDGSILVSFPDVPEALTEGETEGRSAGAGPGLPCRRPWRLCRGAPCHPPAIPGARADHGHAAGARRRQDRALLRDARPRRRQHRAGRTARSIRRRGAPADRPRPPFTHRSDRNGTPCARAAADGRHAGSLDPAWLPQSVRAVLGVSVDDAGWEVVREFLNRRQVDYRIALADSAERLAPFGPVTVLPTTWSSTAAGAWLPCTSVSSTAPLSKPTSGNC